MKLLLPLLCSAVATLVIGCGDAQHSAPHVPVAASPAPEPGSASGESPEVTAATAAATAPECKDLEKADPKTCHPDQAAGDPNAK